MDNTTEMENVQNCNPFLLIALPCQYPIVVACDTFRRTDWISHHIITKNLYPSAMIYTFNTKISKRELIEGLNSLCLQTFKEQLNNKQNHSEWEALYVVFESSKYVQNETGSYEDFSEKHDIPLQIPDDFVISQEIYIDVDEHGQTKQPQKPPGLGNL